MKHQYEDYIKFCDEFEKTCSHWYAEAELNGDKRFMKIWKTAIAFLLANKATLEKHKEVVHYELPTREQKKAGMDYTDPSLAYSTCSCAFVNHYIAGDGYPSISVGKNTFPCPSLLDVTNQLDLVMEERNGGFRHLPPLGASND